MMNIAFTIRHKHNQNNVGRQYSRRCFSQLFMILTILYTFLIFPRSDSGSSPE